MTDLSPQEKAELNKPTPPPLPAEHFQDKLAQIFKDNDLKLRNSWMFERKRRGIHTNSLAIGIQAQDALREATVLMVKCLTSDEDREHFCKTMTEFFK